MLRVLTRSLATGDQVLEVTGVNSHIVEKVVLTLEYKNRTNQFLHIHVKVREIGRVSCTSPGAKGGSIKLL